MAGLDDVDLDAVYDTLVGDDDGATLRWKYGLIEQAVRLAQSDLTTHTHRLEALMEMAQPGPAAGGSGPGDEGGGGGGGDAAAATAREPDGRGDDDAVAAAAADEAAAAKGRVDAKGE
eukprot:CAMPEP_0203828048 /NCGR_PEP_ID=MMETSP0115-20131106/60408_1 /ASSEMBLY_ACC=CAM_ASM_000227 /TAXON_ID=33651 /ORGANISM="Bicosoecid sp, Strain ms1" /LENGTH=117 /DNA_ID=CAMNT_0050737107 /DNA_START=33 /DNA_END=383 /DNA_ORIENTATION=-